MWFINVFRVAAFYKGDAIAYFPLQLFPANSNFFLVIFWI